MASILLSGLYSRADALHVCVLGEAAEAIDAASQLLQAFGAKVSILQTSQDAQLMERLTLTAMAATVRPGDRVLYMHSKGISYEEDSELGLNAYWWTLFMEYFLVQDHNRCLNLHSQMCRALCAFCVGHLHVCLVVAAWHSSLVRQRHMSVISIYLCACSGGTGTDSPACSRQHRDGLA